MKKLILFLALSFATASTPASLITEPERIFNVNQDIADLQNPGATFLQTITDSSVLILTDVRVGLHLVGITDGAGFASEMFVSINKDLADTSILLNQVGVTAGDPVGASYDGWRVTFSDGAVADVHSTSLPSGILTGAWQPDGRADALGSDRPYLLNIFDGGTGNGDWRLSVADLQLGGQMRLESWSLVLSGETGTIAVPERGSTFSFLFTSALIAVCIHQKKELKRPTIL